MFSVVLTSLCPSCACISVGCASFLPWVKSSGAAPETLGGTGCPAFWRSDRDGGAASCRETWGCRACPDLGPGFRETLGHRDERPDIGPPLFEGPTHRRGYGDQAKSWSGRN